ncbi:MAG: hypothetical protein WBE99_06255 [Xanthobacteraceae bacterium]
MFEKRIGAALALALGVTLGLAAVGPLAAQQGTRGAAAAPALQPDPTLSSEDQLAPSQMRQRVPAAVAEPTGGSHTTAHPVMHTAAAPPHPAEPKLPPPSAHVVACTGIFSQSSNALRLAMTFDYKNVTFGDVDADGGTKVKASIVFPNDPKGRLDVWWSNPAERSGTYLIDIKGKSTWGAPGGMRLGLDLMQMEKLNKKPFKLKGFDKNGVATVSDWDGGALAALAGGCKSGVNLSADPKAAADAVSAMSADKEYSSSDPAMRSLKPTVSEILIGY